MSSEEFYPNKSRPALKAMQFQAEESIPQFGPLDKKMSVRLHKREAFTPDQREYKAKGALRNLRAMLGADEDEI